MGVTFGVILQFATNANLNIFSQRDIGFLDEEMDKFSFRLEACQNFQTVKDSFSPEG